VVLSSLSNPSLRSLHSPHSLSNPSLRSLHSPHSLSNPSLRSLHSPHSLSPVGVKTKRYVRFLLSLTSDGHRPIDFLLLAGVYNLLDLSAWEDGEYDEYDEQKRKS
jgi:hypothetical protein